MSSLLVDLTEDDQINPKSLSASAAKTKLAMSSADLLHLILEVEKRQNTDAKACLNLLKIIQNGSTQTIAVLDEVQADKRLRRLLAVPIKLP